MFSYECSFIMFICRSTSGDTIQFVEQSLDTNLLNNAVRLCIPNCPLLPGGVHIQETLNNIMILIVTSQTIHRLVLPHPTRMYHSVSRSFLCYINILTVQQDLTYAPLQDLVTELQMQSIFTDVGKLNLKDPAHCYVIPFSQGSQPTGPSTSAAWISPQGEALFALGSPLGGIMIITLPPHDQEGIFFLLYFFFVYTSVCKTKRPMFFV